MLSLQRRSLFGMSKKSVGMFRGYATADGKFYVAIFADDHFKLIKL